MVKADRKPLLNPKSIIKIGTWNVRSMHITGKVQPIANEMKIYGIHILGIAEARWKEAGQTWLSSGESIIYSGHTGDSLRWGSNHAIKRSPEDTLRMGTSPRIIMAKFKTSHKRVLQCYAPTNEAEEEAKEDL